MVVNMNLDSFLDKLTSIIDHETHLVPRVKDELGKLEASVKLLKQHRLSIPGGKRCYNQAMSTQIQRSIAEAEDTIETYVVVKQHRQKNLFFNLIDTLVEWLSGWTDAGEIIGITKKFEDLNDKCKKNYDQVYREEEEEEESPRRDRSKRPFDDKKDDLDLEFNIEKELIEELLKGVVEPKNIIIPIEGLTDVSRSTLARKAFNYGKVVDHFNLRVWICLSQLHTKREYLEAIMRWVAEPSSPQLMKKMSDEELQSDLYRYMTSTRYLVVVDGVCSSNSWQKLEPLLPNNMLGSKIILTTQSTEVTLSVKPSDYRCYLQVLSRQDSWELLSDKVFQGGECPLELMAIGRCVADKCEGLPLAILLVAGILRSKKTYSWWSTVYGSLRTITVKDESDIFELVYNYLPERLKQCFLYFGHCPEDSEIRTSRLIRLWIAEGFIPNKEQRLKEEVALEYLQDLIDRNLIMPAQNKYDGGVKSSRIHDFLRLLCISKIREMEDLEVRPYHKCSSQGKLRRISIEPKTLHFISSSASAPNLRSLLCFGDPGERVTFRHWKSIYNGFKLLRVLELRDVVVENIPSEIEKLIFLKYLRLKSDSAKNLPISIYNLWNLETLDVMAPLVERPQLNVWKMRQLRHFHFNGVAILPEPPKMEDNSKHDDLSNLQTLSAISPDSCTESVLSKVPNLLELGIKGDLEKHKGVAFKSLCALKHLRKLKLMRDLRCENLNTFPDSQKFPQMLLKLTLIRTELLVDPMEQLGKLPNLRVLKLVDAAYSGKVLDGTHCVFPQLKVLKLINLGITDWNVSPESMPVLKDLVIDRCGGLVALPSSLQKVSTLREMQLYWPNAVTLTWARDIEACLGKEQLKLVSFHADELFKRSPQAT